MASLGGFDKPIIHGLCSLGFSAKAIYEKFAKDDPMAIQKYGARFTSHVFPGETYVIEMWKEGKQIIFQTKTKERGKVALRGYAVLRENSKL